MVKSTVGNWRWVQGYRERKKQVLSNRLTLTFVWQCAFTHGFSLSDIEDWHSGHHTTCPFISFYESSVICPFVWWNIHGLQASQSKIRVYLLPFLCGFIENDLKLFFFILFSFFFGGSEPICIVICTSNIIIEQLCQGLCCRCSHAYQQEMVWLNLVQWIW